MRRFYTVLVIFLSLMYCVPLVSVGQDVANVDVDAPAVSISVPEGVQNGAFDVTITFTEVVAKFLRSDVSLSGAATASVTALVTTDHTVFTATITPTTSGEVTLSVAAGVAEGATNNHNTASEPQTVTVDMDPPAVSILVPPTAQKRRFDVVITFSEPVSGFEKTDLQLTVTEAEPVSGFELPLPPALPPPPELEASLLSAEDTAGTRVVLQSGPSVEIRSLTTTDNITYTANINFTVSGTVEFDIAENVATDAAGNGNLEASEQIATLDKNKPLVKISAPDTAQTGAFDVVITFSEPVSGFEETELGIEISKNPAQLSAARDVDDFIDSDESTGSFITAWESEDNTTYTATITPTLSSNLTFSIAGTVVADAAGNLNYALPEKSEPTVSVDIDPPRIRITVPDGVQKDAFDVKIGIEENLEGFEQADFVLTDNTAGATITAWQDRIISGHRLSIADYTATITPTTSGAVTFSVAEGIVTDAAGNDNTAAEPQTVSVDMDPPGVSISVPEDVQGGASGVAATVFYVTVTFTEPVSDFAQADLSLSGTASANITSWSSTDDTVFTAQIVSTTSGDIVLSIAAEVATDAGGNANTAAEPQTVTVDVDAPGVSISVPEGVQTEAFDVTITFTEPVSDFLETDLVIGGAGQVLMTAGKSTEYTVYTATFALVSSGAVTFHIPAGAATDAAGNENTASGTKSVTVQDTEAVTDWMPDANLRADVRDALGIAPNATFTKAMVGNLKHTLVAVYSQIANLKGLEYATSLTGLYLTGNNLIKDLEPIKILTDLTHLEININKISDVGPLSNLTNLETLDLGDNSVSDIGSLEKLTRLTHLYLDSNSISDISPLEDLTSLMHLYLESNSIVDVSKLSKLTNLTVLDLKENSIEDVSPLEGLTSLTALYLDGNPILDTSPLYLLLSGNGGGGTITRIDIDVSEYAPWDVNEDGAVDASDSALVTAAIGQSGADILNSRTDVNGDGTVDADDLTLVTENLDDDAAAPAAMGGIASLLDRATLESLDPDVIAAQLSILRSKSDGSLKYQRAIALLESMLVALRPVETLLLANYPNPFNPETWLPYHLADASDVVITIYDMRGTVVRRLELGHQREGYYTSRARAAYWDGRNHIGERVASGVYFYQLEADDMSLLRKMVILK